MKPHAFLPLRLRSLRSLFCLLCLAGMTVSAAEGRSVPSDTRQHTASHSEHPDGPAARHPAGTLRILTWNIHNGIGTDRQTDYSRIARIIREARPDVVAVQETDSAAARSQGRYVLGEIARLTGMHAVFAPAIPYGGGKYGVGILCRETPLRVRTLPLPGREEARTAVAAEFRDYVFCCTHLSLTEADRNASLPLLRSLSAGDKPFFLAGDWNATPEEPFLSNLRQEFTLLSDGKTPTYPAPDPDRIIDYIAVRTADTAAVTLLSRKVIEEPTASDHRPVCVEIAFRQPAGSIFRTLPYLQRPTDKGITVMWQTTVPSYSRVEYAPADRPEDLRTARTLIDGQQDGPATLHRIRLEGLEPGRTYRYRIRSQESLLCQAYRKVFGNTAVSPWYEFRLPDPDEEDFTAVVFNDLHQQRATLEAFGKILDTLEYDFVVFNGDCIDDPKDHDQVTGWMDRLTETVSATSVPVFFIRGNHEIRNAYSIGLRSLIDYPDGRTYYAFSWGRNRFVVLDCGEDKPDSHWVYYGLNDFTALRQEQISFLESELRSRDFRRAQTRILLHHIPVYGYSQYAEEGYNPCLESWDPVLQHSRFDLCINGHTHRLEWLPAGKDRNPWPIIIGGGYRPGDAAMLVLRRKDGRLTLRALDPQGNEKLFQVIPASR